MNILSNAKLQFLNIGKYGGMYTDTADFSNKPRPYFSIGLILKGKGKFCEGDIKAVNVEAGNIIIVPTGARYISYWSGTPEIVYITFHFIIEGLFDDAYEIQKVSECDHLKKDFEFAYNNIAVSDKSFKVLSVFYNMLSEIYPKIKAASKRHISASVKKAVDYITVNYKNDITVAELSKIVNLSPSRFFTVFKKETGMTPIEYKNYICVNNAQKMLLADNLSIEEIGESLGFNSASYFRRTFKKYVGKSPREYRNNINSDFKI